MNQENKFGEYWKKFLEYWQAFLAQCGVYWEKVKEYGKIAAQYAALYAMKVRDMLKKLWDALRRNAKQLLQKLAAWLSQVREKAQPLLDRAGERWAAVVARFPALQHKEAEALPETEQVVQALPEAADAAEETDEAVQEEAPKEKNLPEWMSTPWVVKTLAVLGVIGTGIKLVVKWIWKLRRVIMAIPVVWAAVKFAMQNMDRLPESVGLDIQSTGEFAKMITRNEAVYWPLGITAFCLLLMFCSKKPLLPWIISIFTLVLPWLIWLLNYYA